MLILQQAHLDVIGITLQTNSLANFNGLRVGVLSDVKATSYPFVMASSNVETLLVMQIFRLSYPFILTSMLSHKVIFGHNG